MADLDLSMTRAKTGVFFLSVYQEDNITPQSLLGMTLWFHANGLGIEIDKSSPSDGIVINTTAGGADCATLTIDAVDTEGLPDDGSFSIACELTMVQDSDSAPYELNKGLLRIASNVGTP